MYAPPPQFLQNSLQQMPPQMQPQIFHQPPNTQHNNQNPPQTPKKNNKRGKSDANVSTAAKRKNASPNKIHPKKQAKTKPDLPKKQIAAKKDAKKTALMLFVGDLVTSFQLNDAEYATKLENLCKNRLKNYSCETFTIQASCDSEYESALIELEQFIGIKHPLLYLVFVCSSNTDLSFEKFFKSVCQMGINPEITCGILPEPDSDMSKLTDAGADLLIAHRQLAFTVYSKIRKVNIVTLSTWNDQCENKTGPRINRLFNKITGFEPESKKVLKFHANVPKGKLACLSATGKELLKKD